MMTNARLMVSLLAGVLSLYSAGCQREDRPVQAAPEAANQSLSLSQADKDFLMNAEEISLKEVAVARLAEARSANSEIKGFADTLENDHSRGLTKTRDLMRKYGVPENTDPSTLQRDATAKLEQLSGAPFDREFTNMMVEGHEVAIDKFKIAAISANTDVSNYAKDTLPTLEKHLNTAMELQNKTGGTKKTSAQ